MCDAEIWFNSVEAIPFRDPGRLGLFGWEAFLHSWRCSQGIVDGRLSREVQLAEHAMFMMSTYGVEEDTLPFLHMIRWRNIPGLTFGDIAGVEDISPESRVGGAAAIAPTAGVDRDTCVVVLGRVEWRIIFPMNCDPHYHPRDQFRKAHYSFLPRLYNPEKLLVYEVWVPDKHMMQWLHPKFKQGDACIMQCKINPDTGNPSYCFQSGPLGHLTRRGGQFAYLRGDTGALVYANGDCSQALMDYEGAGLVLVYRKTGKVYSCRYNPTAAPFMWRLSIEDRIHIKQFSPHLEKHAAAILIQWSTAIWGMLNNWLNFPG